MGHPDAGDTVPGSTPLHASLAESYDAYPRIEEKFQEVLDGSLNPRGPDSLFDVLTSFVLPAHSVAVDVGCMPRGYSEPRSGTSNNSARFPTRSCSPIASGMCTE
jgi:hypothetical protein